MDRLHPDFSMRLDNSKKWPPDRCANHPPIYRLSFASKNQARFLAGYQLGKRDVGKEGQEGAQQQFARGRGAGEASKDDDEEVAKLPS